MLTRIARNLYWSGRYLERSEHLARYLKVQYFSMLDAPVGQSRQFTLNSIANMWGHAWPEEDFPEEATVLRQLVLDYDSPASIRSIIRLVRENVSTLRHVISTELWESVNAFHLEATRLDENYFLTHGLYDYTTQVGENCAVVRSRIDDTLLQDQVWVFLKLGIHLERVVQVIRILQNKLHDIDLMHDRGADRALRQYQGTVILKILEGFDMHRKVYQKLLTPATMLEFLVGHPHFSRSVTYNMAVVQQLLSRLDRQPADRDAVSFRAGRLYNYFRYLEYEDISTNMGDHLETALRRVYALHDAIAEKYFVAG